MKKLAIWFVALLCLGVIGQKVSENVNPKQPETPEQAAKKASEEREWQAEVLAISALRKAMKSPSSFSLEEALRMPNGSLCLTYRATNSFNAIVPGRAVITKTEAVTSDQPGRFASRWKAQCQDKTGVVITYIKRALVE